MACVDVKAVIVLVMMVTIQAPCTTRSGCHIEMKESAQTYA